MNVIPDKRPIVGLVKDANDGKLCLPVFQRDFVWPRDQVADLLRSLLRGYYIGSLLLLRCDRDKPPFAPEFLRGAKPLLSEPSPDLLVLDGQQRLTSLLYALTAPALRLKDSKRPRRFFVNLALLLKDPQDDDIVFDLPADDLDGLETPEAQFARRTIPCTALFSQEDSIKWQQGLRKWIRKEQPAEYDNFEETQEGKLTQILSDFAGFAVPLVELPRIDENEPGAIGRVCAIFEKLNSTGVELSVYDLLTARLYGSKKSKIELHTLWDEACGDNPRLAHWSGGNADQHKFGVLILRTLALLRGVEVRPSALIELNPKNFAEDWRRAAAAMERALELVTHIGSDGFGVFDPKWLPGYGLLTTLAALRAYIEDQKLGKGARDDLKRWYWCNVFLERYSSAVESKSRKDYVDMTTYWSDGKIVPALFADATVRIGAPGYTIRDSASQASSVYCGIFCLLAIRGAKDWRRGEAIALQDLEDHHIFPQDYLKKRGVEKKIAVNSITNRTLISDETNGKIKNMAPADYLATRDVFPEGPTSALLDPHFVTTAAKTAMQKALDSVQGKELELIYDNFQQAREATIIAEIQEKCGVQAK